MKHTTHKNRIKNQKRKKQSRALENQHHQKIAYALRGGKNFY
jgi:hypothetical protein